MALLGVAWLIVAIIILTTNVKHSASTTLVGTLFVLWAIMLVEYLVRLVVTPDTRGYLKRRWVEPATVVVPLFQGWHFVGMERMSLLVHEGELRVESILKHHGLFRVLIAATGSADTSKSVYNPPFIVFIFTSAFSPGRNEMSSDPLTDLNDVAACGFLAYNTFTPPFTV